MTVPYPVCDFRLLLVAQQPGVLVVRAGAVYRARELRRQDGARADADPGQPDGRLRLRVMLGRGVHGEPETDAFYYLHAHAICVLPAKEAGH